MLLILLHFMHYNLRNILKFCLNHNKRKVHLLDAVQEFPFGAPILWGPISYQLFKKKCWTMEVTLFYVDPPLSLKYI